MKAYQILKQQNNEILSVIRLCDNMIFNLRDIICCKLTGTVYGRITRLWVSHEQLRVDIGRMGLVLAVDGESRNDIVILNQNDQDSLNRLQFLNEFTYKNQV